MLHREQLLAFGFRLAIAILMTRKPDLPCIAGQRFSKAEILWTVELKFGKQLTEDYLPYRHSEVKFIKKLRPGVGQPKWWDF